MISSVSSSGTPLRRRPHRLSPDPLEEFFRIPVYSDLEALAFGDEAPESPPPVVSEAAETSACEPVTAPVAEEEALVQSANPEARPSSTEAGQRGSHLRKRPRDDGTSSGATLPPAPWEPSFLLETGRPMTVEDSLVLETLGRACALPQDMAHYAKLSDSKLLSSLMRSSFQMLQKSMVVIDRFNKQSPLIAELDEERRELEEALGASTQKANQLEASKNGLEAKLGDARAEVEAGKMKIADLEASVERLKSDLQAETQRATEAEARAESEGDAIFEDAIKQATTHYEAKVIRVRNRTWEKAWRAALKEVGIPKGHPSFVNPPNCPGPSTPVVNVSIEAAAGGSTQPEIDVNAPTAPNSL